MVDLGAKFHQKTYKNMSLSIYVLLIMYTHISGIIKLMLGVGWPQSVYLILFNMHNAEKSHLNIEDRYLDWTGK